VSGPRRSRRRVRSAAAGNAPGERRSAIKRIVIQQSGGEGIRPELGIVHHTACRA
jgi:hypothetical protein